MQKTLNSQNYMSLVVYDCFSGPFLANTTPVFYKHIVWAKPNTTPNKTRYHTTALLFNETSSWRPVRRLMCLSSSSVLHWGPPLVFLLWLGSALFCEKGSICVKSWGFGLGGLVFLHEIPFQFCWLHQERVFSVINKCRCNMINLHSDSSWKRPCCKRQTEKILFVCV